MSIIRAKRFLQAQGKRLLPFHMHLLQHLSITSDKGANKKGLPRGSPFSIDSTVSPINAGAYSPITSKLNSTMFSLPKSICAL